MIQKFDFSTFADWMLNTANQVIRYYRGDILIDAKQIVELRNKHLYNSQSAKPQKFRVYWGIRETGTWLYRVDDDNVLTLNDLKGGLGAKHVYLITFQYDTSKNEVITVREVDPNKL